MDDGVLNTLRAADDPVEWECPVNFPQQKQMDRVRSMQGHLESLVGHVLVLEDQVQDASYFAELSWPTEPRKVAGHRGRVILTQLAIRFSAFGRLVTVWGNVPEAPISDRVRASLESALSQAGYVPVPCDALDSPYTGIHKFAAEIKTWWACYFDYC